MDEEGAARLAAAVRERRRELGLGRAQLRELGGPSEPTVTNIEHARPPAPSGVTLAKLDRALAWEPGSAKAALSGGEPAPLDDDQRWVAGERGIAVPVWVITDLVAASRKLTAAAVGGEMAKIAEDLARALAPLYGAYVTHLLERNRLPEGDVTPLVGIFENLMAAAGDEDPRESQERLYRRWLAGMAEVDERTRAIFEARWKASTP